MIPIAVPGTGHRVMTIYEDPGSLWVDDQPVAFWAGEIAGDLVDVMAYGVDAEAGWVCLTPDLHPGNAVGFRVWHPDEDDPSTVLRDLLDRVEEDARYRFRRAGGQIDQHDGALLPPESASDTADAAARVLAGLATSHEELTRQIRRLHPGSPATGAARGGLG